MAAKPTVYIVDDDAGMRQSLKALVESVGLQAETHATGKDFLEAYDAARPGCVILDIRMPGMTGMQLLETLDGYPIPPSVLMLTAYGDVTTAVRAMKAGAIDFDYPDAGGPPKPPKPPKKKPKVPDLVDAD